MSFDRIANIIHILGGIFAYTTLAIILLGIWRGTRRQIGRITGRTGSWLHSPWFYFVTSLLFFSICYYFWVPLSLIISPFTRFCLLALGSLLYFPGILFVLWARLTLGKNYFVSTGLGVQLFADHKLITRGPYSIVRHPMYSGLILAALGSLLLFLTWTTVLLSVLAPFLLLRAQREEAALMAEFGEEWKAYCRRVPAFIPFIKRIK